VDTPRPSPRTNQTRRVPHPVLIGHAAPRTNRTRRVPHPARNRRRARGPRRGRYPRRGAALFPPTRRGGRTAPRRPDAHGAAAHGASFMLAPCSMSFMPRHEASCRSFVLGAVTARHGTAARAAVWMAGRRRGSRVRGDGCRRCGWRARWTRSAGCLTPRRSTASSSRRAPAPAGREMCVRLVRGGERDVRPICTGRGERCASGWYGAGREM